MIVISNYHLQHLSVTSNHDLPLHLFHLKQKKKNMKLYQDLLR